MENKRDNNRITRRDIFQVGSAILATAATLNVANAQDASRRTEAKPDQINAVHSRDHHLPNETDPGPKNVALEAANPDSVWSPETDNGTVPPFKYSFGLSHKRVD